MTSFGFDIPLSISAPAGRIGSDDPARTPGFAVVAATEAAAILPAWRDLAGRALEGNPFFHPDVLVPALAAFGDERVELATVWGIDGRLLAFAPVIACRLGRLTPSVAVWCHDYGPRGTPLVDRDLAGHALSCLIVGIGRQFGRSRPLVFPFLESDGGFAELLDQVAGVSGRHVDRIGRHERAQYHRAVDGADPRRDLETRRRKELARQMRRLGDCGELTVTTAREAGAVVAAFEEFLALEASGWKGRRGTALQLEDTRLRFARDAVAGRAAAGQCQIDALRLDGRPVAMLVSLIGGSIAATWKIAYDEDYARFSPGAQVMLEATRTLLDSPAVQTIDSLATADHPLIDRLWRGRADIATLILQPVDGLLPYRAGLALARGETALRRRLAPRLKQMLRRTKPAG